ncbi:MAG: methyl-accepting chemotaxis protein [Myxococcales bacterium]
MPATPTHIAILTLALATAALAGCARPTVTPLPSGWQYRWGDSPKDGDRLAWEADPWDAPGWSGVELPAMPPGRKDGEAFLWMRVRLPERTDGSSSVFVRYVDQNVEAYVSGQRVLAFGDLSSPRVRMGRPFLLVPVGAGPAGQMLSLRVRSEHKTIGPFGVPQLGSAESLQLFVLRSGLGEFLIGVTLIGLGAAVLLIARVLYRHDRRMAWLGGLSLASGVYALSTVYSPVKQLVFDAPELAWYVELASVYVIPACYFGFFSVVATGRSQVAARHFSRFFFAYAVGSVLLSLAGPFGLNLTDTLAPFHILITLAIVVGLVMAVRAARVNLDARFFLAGMIIVGITGALDVQMDERRFISETPTVVWGFLGFVSCLGMAVILAYSREYSVRDALTARIAAQNDELSEARERMVHAAAEIGAEAKEVIESAARQASTSSELSATNHSTSATAAEIAQISREAARAAGVVVETAEKSVALHKSGEAAVGATVAAIESLASQAASSARSVGLLAERAEQIGTFAELAQDIAEQSNLLAINASIEAAKAGEQGKGFAVVASEMRALAEQSRQASEKIRALLAEVLKDSRAAVDASQQGESSAAKVVDLARQAGSAIASLATAIQDSAKVAQMIARSSHEQTQGVDQIVGAIAQKLQGHRRRPRRQPPHRSCRPQARRPVRQPVVGREEPAVAHIGRFVLARLGFYEGKRVRDRTKPLGRPNRAPPPW